MEALLAPTVLRRALRMASPCERRRSGSRIKGCVAPMRKSRTWSGASTPLSTLYREMAELYEDSCTRETERRQNGTCATSCRKRGALECRAICSNSNTNLRGMTADLILVVVSCVPRPMDFQNLGGYFGVIVLAHSCKVR